jgi:two-component system, cell cycle response regulator CtrA
MRILLASLDGYQAQDLTVVLNGQRCIVERAETADDAVHLARRHHFDVILFGVGAGGVAGTELIRLLRSGGVQLPAIGLAKVLDGRGRSRVLDAGADDIVDLPCDTGELCARLRAVVRRARGFTRSALTVGPLSLHMDSRTATADGRDLHLSPNEYRVLELLTLRKATVVSKTALMDLLYGEFDEPDMKSLNVLMHRLRKRLAAAGIGTMVRTVWGTGYMVDVPPRSTFATAAAHSHREMAFAD